MNASIHIVPISGTFPTEEILTAAERSRAETFHFPVDRERWVRARSALRMILGARLGLLPAEVPITTGPNGKPRLKEPLARVYFNISHNESLALIAISEESEIGIDLEACARAQQVTECAETFCHPAEISALPAGDCRALALLSLWCAKEAALKFSGTGLLFPPRDLHLAPEMHVVSPRGFPQVFLTKLDHPQLADSIAWLATGFPEPEITWSVTSIRAACGECGKPADIAVDCRFLCADCLHQSGSCCGEWLES